MIRLFTAVNILKNIIIHEEDYLTTFNIILCYSLYFFFCIQNEMILARLTFRMKLVECVECDQLDDDL